MCIPCVAVHDGQESELRPKYRGLLHATRTIVQQEGFRGLYRVNLPYYLRTPLVQLSCLCYGLVHIEKKHIGTCSYCLFMCIIEHKLIPRTII